MPVVAAPTATDECDEDVQITFDEVRTDGGCEDSYVLVRTWTATDDCGNTTSQQQVITVDDTTPPVLSGIPADINGNCAEGAGDPSTGITATDNCDSDVEITFAETADSGADGCNGTGTITRTWTATDNCGNTTSAVQIITITDDVAPEIANVPADETVECDAIPVVATPTVTDDCDATPTLDVEEVRTDGACEDSYVLVRTWTAMDACGNTATAQQVITVDDTTDPVLADIPADVTLGCDETVPTGTGNATATDNCDADVEITVEDVETTDPDCALNRTIIRTYTATDNCGNTTSAQQTITIGDDAAPELAGIPADVTVECDNVPAEPTNITATDDCDANPTVSIEDARVDGDCEDSYVITRTFTATDACGNSTQGTQVIVVNDTTDPVLANVPADVTLSLIHI